MERIPGLCFPQFRLVIVSQHSLSCWKSTAKNLQENSISWWTKERTTPAKAPWELFPASHQFCTDVLQNCVSNRKTLLNVTPIRGSQLPALEDAALTAPTKPSEILRIWPWAPNAGLFSCMVKESVSVCMCVSGASLCPTPQCSFTSYPPSDITGKTMAALFFSGHWSECCLRGWNKGQEGGVLQKLTWEDCVFVRTTVGATGFLRSGVTIVNIHLLSGDRKMKRDKERKQGTQNGKVWSTICFTQIRESVIIPLLIAQL